MDFLRIPRDIVTVEPSVVFTVFGYPIANSTLMLGVVVAIVAAISVYVLRRFVLRPTGVQNAIEALYEAIHGVISQIVGSERRTNSIFPLIASLFVFIIISNVLGLVPGIGEILWGDTQVFRTATSDFNTTFALALGVVVLLQVISIKEWGIFAYLGKYFQFAEVYRGFKKSIGDGLNACINFGIGLLDIVGEIAKVVSLSLRLFGNMFAGSVLATVILSGIAIIVPAMWMSLSLLSAVVQTMVFSFLVAAYYTLAIKPDEAHTASPTPPTDSSSKDG